MSGILSQNTIMSYKLLPLAWANCKILHAKRLIIEIKICLIGRPSLGELVPNLY